MDANINIFEVPSRTESKPSSKQEGKTSTDGAFASALSDASQTNPPTESSAPSESADQTSETNTETATPPSTNETNPVPANADGQPAAARDNNNGMTPAGTPVASTAALATPSPTVFGNAVSVPEVMLTEATITSQTQTTPAPNIPSQGSPGQTGAGSQALNQVPATTAPIVAQAQDGGRRLGQSTAPPAPAESLPGQKPAQAAAQPVTQTQPSTPGDTTIAQGAAKESIPAGNIAPPASGPQNPAVQSKAGTAHVSAATSTGALNTAEVMTATAETSPQTAAQNASKDAPLNPHIAAVATKPANASPNGQKTATRNTEITPSAPAAPAVQQASAPSAVNVNPISGPSTAIPTGAHEHGLTQTADTAATTRPANAAIEGLTSQGNPLAAKNGQSSGTQPGQASAGQPQTPSAQSPAAGTQQQAVDVPAQTVRADAPLEGFMTMDVDGAPELLTSAGLQERVHNNLPQTTLNLRLAPGQAPVIAPNDLALHIARQVQAGTTRFEIRMDPPEMGRIEVQMDMRAERPVQAHLFVERSETLDLLQRDSRQLERALQNMGIDVDSNSLSFSLRDGETGTGQNGEQNNAAQTAYEVDGTGTDADIAIPTDIPTEAYGFQLAATPGVNIQV